MFAISAPGLIPNRRIEVHCHVFALGVTVEHAFERELASDAALLVAAIGMARHLPEPLIDLHPAGLDRVRGAQAAADLMRPDIGGETVMAVIGHADRVFLVAPRNRNQHRAENLLTGEAPVV